jgi:hypothetical protein
MGEVEIVEMRGITPGFFKRQMKSVSLSLPSPLILYLLISHERRSRKNASKAATYDIWINQLTPN